MTVIYLELDFIIKEITKDVQKKHAPNIVPNVNYISFALSYYFKVNCEEIKEVKKSADPFAKVIKVTAVKAFVKLKYFLI